MSVESDERLPKLVAFDIDYTLWDLWIDTHVTPPFRRRKDDTINEVVDKYNQTIAFYPDVPDILHRLKAAGVIIAACSRTDAPRLARQALSLLLMPAAPSDQKGKPFPAMDFFDQAEIYPGSKLTHFKRIHENTGIPYSEMLFYDDESRNREFEKLGITFCLVPRGGVDSELFEKGLSLWRKRHPAEEDS